MNITATTMLTPEVIGDIIPKYARPNMVAVANKTPAAGFNRLNPIIDKNTTSTETRSSEIGRAHV